MMKKEVKHIWNGREINNYKDIRWALSGCKNEKKVMEFIKVAVAWGPGEREEYLGLLGMVCESGNLSKIPEQNINNFYDESALDEIRHEIKCLGDSEHMVKGYQKFIKQFCN